MHYAGTISVPAFPATALLPRESSVIMARPPVCRAYFWRHAALSERLIAVEVGDFLNRKARQRPLCRLAPVGIHGVHVCENHEQIGADSGRKHRGRKILVDHAIDAFECARRVAKHGYASAATGDND